MKALVLPLLLCTAVAKAAPVISEFMASNDSTLADEEGHFPDWIELHNPGPDPVPLEGYYLTDDLTDLTGWKLPAITLEENGHLVIFASGKDRRDVPGTLHTDFRLSAAGESLALVAPDGATILSSFSNYPEQYEDVSYGRDTFDAIATEALITQEAQPRFLVPQDDALGASWRSASNFDDSSWAVVQNGLGWEGVDGVLKSFVSSDVSSDMQGVNASAYIRYRFNYTAGDAPIIALNLKTWADDGFVCYLNGIEAGRLNAPDDPQWNSSASGWRRDPDIAAAPETINLLPVAHALQEGENILAVQVMNSMANGKDLLFLAELEISSQAEEQLHQGYYDVPTPNAANSSGTGAGPDFFDVMNIAPQPAPETAFSVTADIEEVNGAISEVMLHYVIGDDEEVSVPMAHLNGNRFSGTIPGGTASQLIKWRYSARDNLGFSSKSPAFQNPADSHQYYGTVVNDPSVQTLLPTLEWFIDPQEYNRLISFAGPIRGGLFYLGEYYDNVTFTLHGQSTLFFDKKSFNIDFNKSQRFLWKEGELRAKDIDLLTNWADKSKVRHVLAYEVMRDAGVPTHFAFSVRVQQNGEFFSIADFVEDSDNHYLERAGLNPEGALYKAYNTTLSLNDIGGDDGVNKKTRKGEGNDDLHALINGINQTGEARWDYIYDHIDLPTTINTLAGLIVNMQTDVFNKNYYLYRDTGKTGEWAFLPWDLDLTFGRIWRANEGQYFNNENFWDGYTEHEESTDTVLLVDFLINDDADTRAMFFRRLRTVLDQYIQESSTPLADRYLERRFDELLALMDPPSINPSDAQMDFEKWGSWRDQNGGIPVPWTTNDPAVESMREAVERLRSEWLPLRRIEVYTDVPDLPAPQENPTINFGTIEYAPASNNQDEEYIELINPETVAVDISGWRLANAVELTIPFGTVIPAGGRLFVSPDPAAFRARTVSPTGNEQRFVVGSYSGRLSSLGETIDLFDDQGVLKNSITFVGSPSDAQRYLVVSEIHYNPPGKDDSEYLEILNTSDSVTVDLTGVHFTSGESFNFTGSMITSLAPGERALVVKNIAAFEAAFGTGHPIAGAFDPGSTLSNGSELIKIEDPDNGTIQEFTYRDDPPWPVHADGTGLALILDLPFSRPDHDDATNWKAGVPRPGAADPLGFTGDAMADDDGDGLTTLLEYALGTSDTTPDLETDLFSFNAQGEFSYQENLAAFDVSLEVQVSSNLFDWFAFEGQELSRIELDDGTVRVTVQLPQDLQKRFIRVKATGP